MWVFVYTVYVVYSSFLDDMILLTNIFFIIALAGLEFSVGFVLIMALDFFLNINNEKTGKKKIYQNFKDIYSAYTCRYVVGF